MARSVHWRLFQRRCAVALRTGLAALLAGGLVSLGSLSAWMVVPFFSAVLAILITDATLGKALKNAVLLTWGCLGAALTALLARKILGPSRGAMLSTLAATSFIFSYPDVDVLVKKIALAVGAITYVMFASVQSTPLLFPLRLCATGLAGAACAIVAMLLPIPQLAYVEVKKRLLFAAQCESALLKTLLDAFGADDARALAFIEMHVKILSKTASSNVVSLKERELDLSWELWLYQKPLQSFRRIMKLLDALIMHSAGMELALAKGEILHSPRALRCLLREPLSDLSKFGALALAAAVNDFWKPHSRVRAIEVVRLGNELLQQFNHALRRAREVAYYHLPADKEDSPVQQPAAHGSDQCEEETAPTNTPSLVDSQFFIFNAKHFVMEILHFLEETASPGEPSGKRRELHVVDSMYNLQKPEVPVTVRPEGNEPSTLGSSSHNPAGAAETHYCDGSRWHQARRRPQQPWWTWWQARNWPRKVTFKLNTRRLKSSAKIAVSMVISAILGDLITKPGFWAPVTVAFVIGGHQGGSFQVSLLRLQGTVAGAVYGYLAILLTHHSQWLILAALVPWVVLSSYIRYSKAVGYAGIVSAFTAAIIMLGYRRAALNVHDYALNRIAETCTGITCFIVVEALLWPHRAVKLVRQELVSCLSNARRCFSAIVASYMGQNCSSCHRRAIEMVAEVEEDVSKSILLQTILAEEAAAEPDLWHAPFPAQIYSQLVRSEGRILSMLFFMDCCLRATCSGSADGHFEKLVYPLRSSLLTLEAEVLQVLDRLLQALEPSLTTFRSPSLPHTLAAGRQPCSPGMETSDDAACQSQDGRLQHDIGGHSPPASERKSGAAGSRSYRGASSSGRVKRREVTVNVAADAHPLLLLGQQKASRPLEAGSGNDTAVDALQAFELRYNEVIGGLIAAKREDPAAQIVNNSVMLSFNALVFSMRTLIKETVDLEYGICELLQVERPLNLDELSAAYIAETLLPTYAPSGQQEDN
eukprot:SM000149S01323  [mRNA]  locus=s149:111:8229:+ [translate_table: standard]